MNKKVEDESTVITIKISKEDYYELLQSKQSFELSCSGSEEHQDEES